MLTEARVIIPGGQALLGFQFVCTFTRSFRELPLSVQYLHGAGLCAVAVSVLLLMTPAALHRLAFHGENDTSFFRIGSALVVVASIPLAIGVSADIAVVFFKVTDNKGGAAVTGALALGVPDRRLAGISPVATKFSGSLIISPPEDRRRNE